MSQFDPIARMEHTVVGPKLFVCGVEVHWWLGTLNDPHAAKLADEVNAAYAARQSVETFEAQEFRPGAASETNTGVVAGPKALNDAESIAAEPAKSGLTTQAGSGRPEELPRVRHGYVRDGLTESGDLDD